MANVIVWNINPSRFNSRLIPLFTLRPVPAFMPITPLCFVLIAAKNLQFKTTCYLKVQAIFS
jgi:hypothetical protein